MKTCFRLPWGKHRRQTGPFRMKRLKDAGLHALTKPVFMFRDWLTP